MAHHQILPVYLLRRLLRAPRGPEVPEQRPLPEILRRIRASEHGHARSPPHQTARVLVEPNASPLHHPPIPIQHHHHSKERPDAQERNDYRRLALEKIAVWVRAVTLAARCARWSGRG